MPVRARRLDRGAADPDLASFILRASDAALDPDDRILSLLTHLAGKPPTEWSDADETQSLARLEQVARRFRSAEVLAVGGEDTGDDWTLLRLAVARRGRPEQERLLQLRPADTPAAEALCDRILDAAREAGATASPSRTLAALALAAERLLGAAGAEPPRPGRQPR